MGRVRKGRGEGDADCNESDEYRNDEKRGPYQSLNQEAEAERAEGCSYSSQCNQRSPHISFQRYDKHTGRVATLPDRLHFMSSSLASRAAAWSISLAVVFAACSGTPASTTTSTQPSADVVVTMSDWRFAPGEVAIAAGTPIVLELRNTGTVLHEWAVIDGTVETEADLPGLQIIARREVNAGGVERLQLPGLDSGVYTIVCPVPGHIANGMVGTLTVGD